MNDLNALKAKITQFNTERNWQEFHSPKNLALAISSEAGELADIMRWLTEEQSDNLSDCDLQKTKEEMADIFIFLIILAERLGIDLITSAHDKILKNDKKYPACTSFVNPQKNR